MWNHREAPCSLMLWQQPIWWLWLHDEPIKLVANVLYDRYQCAADNVLMGARVEVGEEEVVVVQYRQWVRVG